MRRLRRIPGPVLAHTAVPEFPIPAPSPLLPYIATEPPPSPGVHFLPRRWAFCQPTRGGPPFERAPQSLYDRCERDASRPESPVASLVLERLEGFPTHPAPVGALPRAAHPQERPLPRAGNRTRGFVDRPRELPVEDPRPTGAHPRSGSCPLPVDSAIVRVAHKAVAAARKRLLQPVQQ
jgi:hypothetical protein